MSEYFSKTPNQIAQELNTDLNKGLTIKEAKERLEKYGPNEINLNSKFNIFKAFIEQLKNPLVTLLLIVTAVAFTTGEIIEAVLILTIVLFMAGIGVYLENKAGNAVEQLKNLSTTFINVIRNNEIIEIPSQEVVIGDLILIYDGDKIPADCRLTEVNELMIDEALLSGESIPRYKQIEKIEEKVVLSDQINMVFSGTYVIQGNAKAIVVATALNTEIGKIATKLGEVEEKETPLQLELNKVSKFLFITTIVICTIILTILIGRGNPIVDSLIETLSLAVAFIPEGLSAVMTITLAIGVREMVKKHVIIKRLLAAEGLGSIAVLATDKTGTITTGKMSIEKIWVNGFELGIDDIQHTETTHKLILDIIKYCNNFKGSTEIAMVDFLKKKGIEFSTVDRIKEHMFSSHVKRMMVIKQEQNGIKGYAKGAPEIMLPLCHSYIELKTGKEIMLDEEERTNILNQVHSYATQGYRVICLTYREFDNEHKVGNREQDEQKLVFVGLITIIDPIRDDVLETVNKLKIAGIRPIMITGDHPEIAKTIAIKAGIISSQEEKVITGIELDALMNNLTAENLEKIATCNVFARVSPTNKNDLIDVYKKKQILIAMAGDGVNDAVAVSKSNIGIAVANATDIVKESADVIVTGSYSALANAVEVGRTIIFRTKLYLNYLLSGNICQVGVFIIAILLGYPAPLTALGLLLINVLTDAAPAMSIAFEKADSTIMSEKPRKSTESIIDKLILQNILILGLISSIYLFVVFSISYKTNGILFAQTATFTAYIFQKAARGLTARSFKKSILNYGLFTNKPMIASLAVAMGTWGTVVYVFNDVFKMVALPLDTVFIIFITGMSIPIFEEFVKLFNKKSSENFNLSHTKAK